MYTVITSKSLKFLDIVGGAALQEASILVDFRIYLGIRVLCIQVNRVSIRQHTSAYVSREGNASERYGKRC
jgi:hypothetical protein